MLRGGGDWELKLQVLEKSDVRALNERELTQQEKDEVAAVHTANSVTTQIDIDEQRRIQAAASVGEGYRRPSWIWFSGVNAEGLDDPMTCKGKLLTICTFWF